ncbi:MAG TPA: SRPBCC family protein [Solirubrobacteraceae bacterium]|nr:SRPBCC family protein [Solirubrobacteraceae bacterium]
MIQGEKSQAIEAPPDRIWAIVADIATYPRWHPFFSTVDVSGRDPAGRATRAACAHPTPVGVLHTQIAITYDPVSQVEAVRAGGDLKAMRGTFVLEAADGATLVTHRLVVDPGFRLGLLLHGRVADRVRESVLAGALNGLAAQVAADV